jgi:threonine synthase
MAQCVYYFTATLGLKEETPASFVVPTGNFGDVFAGEAAWRMGLGIEKLVVATNSNNILARALETGVYSAGAAQATLSPSMDIQVASNFERALFEASGRDGAETDAAMRRFDRARALEIPPEVLLDLRKRYVAGAANDDETLETIGALYRTHGIIIDPHTAVGIAAAGKLDLGTKSPLVFLATAHPAKFPDAVEKATGVKPELPARLSDLLDRKENCTVLPNAVDAVRDFIGREATVG